MNIKSLFLNMNMSSFERGSGESLVQWCSLFQSLSEKGSVGDVITLCHSDRTFCGACLMVT